MEEYRSLDYAENVALLKAKGYLYLTFFDEREVSGESLRQEYGYEDVAFREAIPSIKPQPDDGISVHCFPIESEETILMLDNDEVSYQVAVDYF
jgi:hypothetical protein